MAWRPFRHAGLKVAALGLGTLLWLTVSGQQVERPVLVQLQLRNVPSTLEVTGDVPRTVNVMLRGASGDLGQLQPGDLVATIDLAGARAGVRVFPMTPDRISVPLGVEVKSVEPSTVSLTLDETGSAEAVVKPTIDGEPARGFEVGEVTVSPTRVVVDGPLGRLKEHPTAVTERISIEGATDTMTETVGLGVSDPAVRLRRPETARVTVAIVPSSLARFVGRPVRFRGVAQGHPASAVPASVTVTARGTRDAVGRLADGDIEPYIDLAGLAPGRYNLQVRVDPRGEYAISTIEPATVAVTIR
jgi:YbbR domain-containing protein